MKLDASLRGLDTILNRFETLKKDAARAQSLGLKRAAIRTRDSIVGYTNEGHPDHPEVQTGRLKASIRYEPTEPVNVAYVGSDADYAVFVEFGHAQEPGRFVPALGKRLIASTVKAYPFVRPAIVDVFDSGEGQKIFEGAVKEVLHL